jgi:predicted transcriptional regulator
MALHLAPELEEKLQHFASQAERTPDDLAQEAVESYLKYLEALAADVREGEESAEGDGWLSHEEVFERLNKRLLKTA